MEKINNDIFLNNYQNNVNKLYKSQEITIDGRTIIIDVLVGDSEILFGLSDDGGETFEIKNISNMPGESFNSRMRIDGNNIYLVWTDIFETSEIFFSKSNDSGYTFSNPINVSNSNADSFDAGINISEENVFLIWKEQHDNNTEIYFSKSNDGGNSFDQPRKISGDFGNYKITRDTQIDVSNPHLYVVYYDDVDVYLAHSPDKGDTFYDSINLSTSIGQSVFSQLLVDENKIFVIWSDDSDGDEDVYLRESSDYGFTFGPKINLSDDIFNSVLFVLGPQISKSDNFINVIWENKTNSESNLVLKQKPINNSPLSFILSNNDVQISLDGYEIQPGEKNQIEIKFRDLKTNNFITTNYSISIFDSENKTIFQSPQSVAINGLANHTVVFPKPDQYSLSINVDEQLESTTTESITSRTTSGPPVASSANAGLVMPITRTRAIVPAKSFCVL